MRILAVVVLLSLLVVGGCVAPVASTTDSASAMPEPVAGQVTVENARARAMPMAGGTGTAFMLILNGTDAPVRFTAAASDIAEAVELHETVDDNGVMRMIPQPDGFEIPAGGSVELAPGGKHVMFIGVNAPLEAGATFTLTLNFEGADPIVLAVPVVAMDGMPAMEH